MTLTAMSTTGDRSLSPVGDSYLKFELSPGISAALLMPYVQEASTIPLHRLTPIPNMPDCILGLMHRRSQVLWVLDLAKFLGSNHLEASTQRYDIVILRVGQTPFAAVVHRIEGMVWLCEQDIQPPQNSLDPQLTNYLNGYAVHAQEALLILDAEAIAQSSLLQGHTL